MKYLCLLIVMMTTVVLMAADPVGRVTSSGPLTLNGKAVPATAVSSLPVVAGDEIATVRFLGHDLFHRPEPRHARTEFAGQAGGAQLFGDAAGFVRVGRPEAGRKARASA